MTCFSKQSTGRRCPFPRVLRLVSEGGEVGHSLRPSLLLLLLALPCGKASFPSDRTGVQDSVSLSGAQRRLRVSF